MYILLLFTGLLMLLSLRCLAKLEQSRRYPYYVNTYHTTLRCYDTVHNCAADFVISRPHVVLGRRERRCDLCLYKLYRDESISRCHCILYYQEGNFHLKPLYSNSAGGYTEVYIGNKRVPPGGCPVYHGESIHIQGHRIQLLNTARTV